MQIDFHHTVTYVLARLAGFDPVSATTVASSAQYVDDAVGEGTIHFETQQLYEHVSSAHRMLDYRNLEELANHLVWVPFHFLPGNDMLPAGNNPNARFQDKLVCRPDSPVAREMVETCLRDRRKPYALHRLGITLHVYADTWAHQEFSGINDANNMVVDLATPSVTSGTWGSRLKAYFRDAFDEASGRFVGGVMPLGHGAALSNPDLPYLNMWTFTRLDGTRVSRNNTDDFMTAATRMYQVMLDFLDGNEAMTHTDNIPQPHRRNIRANFQGYTDPEGEARHKLWLADIQAGKFGFSDDLDDLAYVPEGDGSWKVRALGGPLRRQGDHVVYSYQPYFLRSDWKHFHDALQAHRFDVLHDILPRYNICAA